MFNSAFRLTVYSGLALTALITGSFAPALAEGGISVDPSSVTSSAGDMAVSSVAAPNLQDTAEDRSIPASSPPRATAPRATAPRAAAPAPSASGTAAKATESRLGDSNKAREAGRKGMVRPYGWMLKKIRKIVPGDVVKVQLMEHPGDLWTYDVTVLSESGRYVKISLNANTGSVISKKSR